jgi:hypothetical protein
MPEINGKQTECPNCHVIVSNEPSNDEYRVMTEESRLRIIKAMKASGRQNQYIECFLSNQSTITLIFRSPYFFLLFQISFWSQFEQGILTEESVKILVSVADTVIDRELHMIHCADLRKYWTIQGGSFFPLISNLHRIIRV